MTENPYAALAFHTRFSHEVPPFPLEVNPYVLSLLKWTQDLVLFADGTKSQRSLGLDVDLSYP